LAKTAKNVSRLFWLKQNSFETVLFRFNFTHISLQFYFNCADSLKMKQSRRELVEKNELVQSGAQLATTDDRRRHIA